MKAIWNGHASAERAAARSHRHVEPRPVEKVGA